MPFGLKNAGATLVRAVRSMLRPIHDLADLYVDDIGVGSQDWESHLYHICRFLSTLYKQAARTLRQHRDGFLFENGLMCSVHMAKEHNLR